MNESVPEAVNDNVDTTTATERWFRHVLVTRLNVRVGFAPSEQRLSDDWLRARMAVFRQVCQPSLQAQDADVEWVMLADPESPAWLQEELSQIEGMDTLYLSDGDWPAVATALVEAGYADRDYLVTSRVDSDDALATDFARVVQSMIEPREEWFTFPVGVETFRGGFYGVVIRTNPFLTYVEPVSTAADGTRSVRTVMSENHHNVATLKSPRTTWRRPMWLVGVHAVNNETTLHGGAIPLRNRPPAGFVCHWDEPEDNLGTRIGWCVRALVGRLTRIVRKRLARR